MTETKRRKQNKQFVLSTRRKGKLHRTKRTKVYIKVICEGRCVSFGMITKDGIGYRIPEETEKGTLCLVSGHYFGSYHKDLPMMVFANGKAEIPLYFETKDKDGKWSIVNLLKLID